MNRLSRTLLVSGMAALLGGCSALGALPGLKGNDLDSQLDTWIVERQYGRALNALSAIDPKDPQYSRLAEKRRKVESLAKTYEKEMVEQATKHMEQGNWAGALNAYDRALRGMPDSTYLKDGLAELHRKQSSLVAEQRLNLMVARARFLERALPVYERIARIDPRDQDAGRALKEHRRSIRETAEHLARTGSAALEAGEYEVAERTLPLAASISNDERVQSAHTRLKEWHAARKRASQEARERRLKRAEARKASAHQHFDELMSEYRRTYEDGQYQNARKILEKLEETTLHQSEVESERKQLEVAIDIEVDRLFEEGVTYYSRGEFERAVQLWKRILKLRPEHRPAMDNLDRAERVLERLKQLREKQAQRNSAENAET
ncbi:tetratricopeptide repeat protein [Thiohalomonas denitrificans]|uniref:Tetratricopeptide repeat-containing protein n=1 Tax=Thiohalomonas denitrificans TaxID=415747 RepID=A0A1G5PZV0_9GAMM|nr:hypothetical protein [Thiohalomonas denitrificans]SCZ54928.1 hypothetical protein SAMN03097708_01048 [Thiohalomonas denitrificans]